MDADHPHSQRAKEPSMTRREAPRLPEGRHLAACSKSIRGSKDNRPFWITIFQESGREARVFFHLDVPSLVPMIEKHARRIGFKWTGDVVEALKAATADELEQLVGWTGYIDVTDLGFGKTRTRIVPAKEQQ